ncbi:MAG: GtrA family protein [Arachnia propionica]|uniref:GtrA family protein n=1 Tax=Arachnia propionica TaxID=1750 RepID=UPI00270301FD|nr:GtrA family protein [Arachnia propionica]
MTRTNETGQAGVTGALVSLWRNTILRYVGVGGLAFVVDLVVTVVLRDHLGIALWLAVACGYWAGFVVNFTLQRSFAFQGGRNIGASLVKYLMLVGFNWAATTLVMQLLVEGLGVPTAVAKILCTLMTTVWNYPLYRFLVFPTEQATRPQAEPVPRPGTVEFVIPAHNSETVLEETVRVLRDWGAGREVHTGVLIVENASTDATHDLATRLAGECASETFTVAVLRSGKGMGAAYRRGIEASRADRVVLTADDLPFGTSDIDGWWAQPRSGLAIGSKAHPDSVVERGLLRRVSTRGFSVLRGVILGSRVGDTQGTLIVDGDWLRDNVSRITEQGYLCSTQVVALAEQQGVAVTEIPVVLTSRQGQHATRLRPGDVWRMAVGLLRLRRALGQSEAGTPPRS